nr:RibD C-terminal domain protein [uncultured bacterium]AIA17070.1 FGGY family of carbohydrate kinases, C-terminal domain protein [uncultured bacterium]
MANLPLDEIEVYQRAMQFGERIYRIVFGWRYFYQSTIGRQLIKSSDSIAANISEGYGRYFYKENRNFCFYARGSLTETKTWIAKAINRDLIPKEEIGLILKELEVLHKLLNGYINSIGRNDQ